jgi:hypothetical protein
VTGIAERAVVAARLPGDTVAEQTKSAHIAASVRCSVGVERYMRNKADKGEVAMMIYENTNHARKLLREVHNSLKLDAAGKLPLLANWPLKEFLPVTRIVDTAHFADKADTCMLQIADACAFAVRRHMSRAPHGKELVECFNSCLWSHEPASSQERAS